MQKIPKALLYITAGLGLVVIILLVFLAGYFMRPEPAVVANTNAVNTNTTANRNTTNENVNIGNINNANTNSVNTNTTNTNSGRMAAGASGITWQEPELIEDQGLFDVNYGGSTYYKVGERSDGAEIIYMYRDELGSIADRFIKNADGSFVFLANHSEDGSNPNFTIDTATTDTETVYSELTPPDTLDVNDLALVSHVGLDANYTLYVELSEEKLANLEEFGTTDYGTVYELTTDLETEYDNGSIKGKMYLLVLADNSIVSYTDEMTFMNDDDTISGTWAKTYADFAERSYMRGLVVSGCGAMGGNQYATDLTPEALDVVGSTNAEDDLYTILDAENPILQNAYESYKLGRDYEGSEIELLSYEEFVDATPVLIWQDAVGDYILFLDTTYAPAVECGKPVVYLYPTETTNVSVQVAADVRISEPEYGSGWTVTAQPNGQLTMLDGTTYGNLFWEGKGLGVYPDINFGRVVDRTQVGAALRSDLIKQGLNAQEIKDFLEFWMPHMPNSNYVRLSWLSTAQMNALAPLTVTPRPDTVIRVFLDFAGQDTATTKLQPQTLITTPRNGFTVTEWGGLLLGQ